MYITPVVVTTNGTGQKVEKFNDVLQYTWAVVDTNRGEPILTFPYNYWVLSLGSLKPGTSEMTMTFELHFCTF